MPDDDRPPTRWSGRNLAGRPERYVRRWTNAELDDLLSLASSADLSTSGVPAGDASPDTPVARLARSVRADLIDGLGFVVVAGFPIDEVPQEGTARAFTLFAGLVGGLRPQNASGHRLGHVIDQGVDADDPAVRIYQTNQRQTFHTDGADAVGLLCVRTAKHGGESMLVSVEETVAEMDRRRPGLSDRLFEPVATDRRGEEAPGERPFFTIPVLSREGGRLTVCYQRQYIESAQRFSGAPRLDDEYVAALDLFDDVMNDPDVHLRLEFRPGDMQFVHNHALLHDRTGFVDHSEPDRRRHLLRVWLTLPGDRPLVPAFAERYGTTAVGERGGVLAGLDTPAFPLYPS